MKAPRCPSPHVAGLAQHGPHFGQHMAHPGLDATTLYNALLAPGSQDSKGVAPAQLSQPGQQWVYIT